MEMVDSGELYTIILCCYNNHIDHYGTQEMTKKSTLGEHACRERAADQLMQATKADPCLMDIVTVYQWTCPFIAR